MADVATIKRPSPHDTRDHGIEHAKRLHKAHYWLSPDALNLFDLSDDAPVDKPDPLRHSLQDVMPEKLLDQAGKDRRAIEREKRSGTGGKSYSL